MNDEDIVIDYSASSSEVPWPLNGVHNFTFAYSVYPLKCAIGPEIPNNSGTIRPFKVIAPEGSVLNCRHPAPVGLRHINGLLLHAVLYHAMYDAIPDQVIAPSGTPSAIAVIAGKRLNGEPFVTYLFLAGGMGARSHRDGVNTVAFPATVTNVPIEVAEEGVPLMIERKQHRPDSGGRGKHRGGFGQEVHIRNVSGQPMAISMLSDRNRFAPKGLAGGGDGSLTRILLESGKPALPKGRTQLEAGDCMIIQTPGGAGYGNEAERSAELTAGDVADALWTA